MTKRSRKPEGRKAVPEIHPVLRTVHVGSLEMEARAQLRDVLICGGMAVATAMLEEEVERLCVALATPEERGWRTGGARDTPSLPASARKSRASSGNKPSRIRSRKPESVCCNSGVSTAQSTTSQTRREPASK